VNLRDAREAVVKASSAQSAAFESQEYRMEGSTGRVVSISDWRVTSLTAVDRVPRHNLPALLSSFLGRDIEFAELRRLLEDEDVRLLTLTGPGGTGKTRLSVALAEASGASSPGVLRSDHERNLSLARQALGEQMFYHLWRQGRRMSPEQIVDFALESDRRD
jgi:hypothetical protein